MGGYIIDTPGIKMLSFNNLEPWMSHIISGNSFKSSECRFPNCLHRDEPGCAVKLAIEQGTISSLRYEHYLQILSEIDDQNYWERHKNM
jgi:ribosome biogenesis GTPase